MFWKALTINKELVDSEGMANSYGNFGNVLLSRDDLDWAEEMFGKALEIDKKLNRPEGMGKTYANLGIVLQERGNLHGADEMYRKAIESWKQLGLLDRVERVQKLLDALQDK